MSRTAFSSVLIVQVVYRIASSHLCELVTILGFQIALNVNHELVQAGGQVHLALCRLAGDDLTAQLAIQGLIDENQRQHWPANTG